jgi:hypothetical protein
MKIAIDFLSGKIQEFDTESKFNSTELFDSNKVAVAETDLDINNLDHGLWLNYYFYDCSKAESVKNHDGLCVPRIRSYEIQIIDPNEMKDVATVTMDGEKILWRIGCTGKLVNGIKFMTQSTMYVTKKDDMPLNVQAVELYHALKGDEGIEPELPQKLGETDQAWDKRIADEIGWDVETLLGYVRRVDARDEADAAAETRNNALPEADIENGLYVDD